MVTYQVREEKLFQLELGSYTAFGIAVLQDNKLVEYVPDVFLEGNAAEEFVKLCNELALDSEHLRDVIEDTIGQ